VAYITEKADIDARLVRLIFNFFSSLLFLRRRQKVENKPGQTGIDIGLLCDISHVKMDIIGRRNVYYGLT
jgi:hypothetical protein